MRIRKFGLVAGCALFLSAFGNARSMAPNCPLSAGARPNQALPAGSENSSIPIRHVLIIMQENHSFDNYFGRLNQPQYYGSAIDGLTDDLVNNDREGHPVHPHHEPTLCPKDPGHRWNDMHQAWNGGRNDQFVKINGPDSIGYYDQRDLPYYYELANRFAVADRYFCSTMTQTFPNRFYFLAGTSFGHIRNQLPKSSSEYSQPTIFDLLGQYGVSWRYYANGKGYLPLFQPAYRRFRDKIGTLEDYAGDLKSDHFPQVAFIESSFEKDEDEHPNENIQIGQAWAAERISPFMASRYWNDSVLFLTYDENGGFYDHVAPPAACAPDQIKPMLKKNSLPGDFAQYGFRVPFVAVSPYAKHHYVSHVTYDHTSILRFIETKFNLPALTARDANADPMLDLFDFQHPEVEVPRLPPATIDRARTCEAAPPKFNGPHGA